MLLWCWILQGCFGDVDFVGFDLLVGYGVGGCEVERGGCRDGGVLVRVVVCKAFGLLEGLVVEDVDVLVVGLG